MANKVTIDVEARFIDNVTDEAKAAAKSFDNLEKAAEDVQKDLKDLGKTNAKPKVDADTSRAEKKLTGMDKKLDKLGRSKTEAKLSLLDKATAVIEKVTSKAKAFAGKTYSALVKLRDSNVLSSLSKMSSGIKSLTSKAWNVAVKIKDTFTAPLTKLKNMLFNVRTLIAGIASAWAAMKLVVNPINVADAYSSAKIGFSTLLGDSAGQKMMDDLDAFAKATPFKTTGVIANAQKMMAMGWDVETIIEDMETIGNAAAATGKMDQGLESIVRALSQIKTKGRLSTEELNQLAEAGIAAKAMLAENLGYGTGDGGIAQMTEDLENGAIASDVAIQALLSGMRKYDGMMDSMANETVEGLISQMQDAFEINLVRKWGQGLQDGAKKGFGTVIQLLDESEEALSRFGDILYEIGKTASNWVANKLQGVLDKIRKITETYEFQNADLKGKIKMLWEGLVTDPLKEWWEGGGREKTVETAGKIGSWMGEMLTKGLLAIFGATDVLDEKVGTDAGSSVAGSFVQGFLDNFNGKAITDAFVDAIGNVWGALPTWVKILIGGYAAGKLAGGIANFAGGISNFVAGVGKFIGSSGTMGAGNTIVGASGLLGLIGKTGVSGVGASGILGSLANTGYTLVGGTSALTMTGGMAALIGGASVAGGIAGGASLIKGGIDLYRGYTTDDEVEARASKTSGYTALGATAAGAAIGTLIMPGVGTLIGAGIGGIAGWIGGNVWADKIRETDDAINDVTAATEDLENEQEKLEVKNKMVWQNMKDHFGEIKLSMSEIQSLAKQIVWGDDLLNYEQFTAAANTAEASLKSLKTASETTNRWMWKAGLGIKFSQDEIESIAASFDEYITAAINYAENKHYEFTAAVSLFVDTESGVGKSIIASGNAFYAGIQEQLNSLGTELAGKVKIALQDGVIELNEYEEIISLQKQIAEITKKLADAETAADLELIKLKFGKGNLDLDSFDNFMEQMGLILSERIEANDNAFTAAVSALQLQLAEGAITQQEYDEQLQALIAGYKGEIDEIKATVKNVELEIIAEAYSGADALGPDAMNKLNMAMERCIAEGIDPINWTTEQARMFLNTSGLSESAADAIGEMLSGVIAHMKMLTVDGKLKVDYTTETNNVVEIVESQIPESMDADISVHLTAFSEIMNHIDILAEEFGIDKTRAETILWKLSATKGITNKLEILCTEFGIDQTRAEMILWKLSGQTQVMNFFTLSPVDFGLRTTYNAYPIINVSPRLGSVSTINLPTSSLVDDWRKKYRGGIVGGYSAMDAFARGGETGIDGIVGGSTRFIRVNEESPEMIIPLSSQRRERALKLFNKTGELLDVPGFARGGNTGGGQDEGIRFNTYGSGESTGGRTVQINMGGFKLEIHVSGSDRESIVDAIKAQAGELADYFAGQLADALATEFENTPVKGGVA